MNAKLTGIHDTLATCHPKLAREHVWCHACGSTLKVDSAACLRSGWPKCCGQTMSIDSPEERKQVKLIASLNDRLREVDRG